MLKIIGDSFLHLKTVFLGFCFLNICLDLHAQDSTITANSPEINIVKQGEAPIPKVLKVISNGADPNEAGIGDEITISIEHIEILLERAKSTKSKIILYIDDIPVKDAVCEPANGALNFLLINEGDVITLWNHLISGREKTEILKTMVNVSVGIDGEDPIDSEITHKNNKGYILIMAYKTWFVVSLLFVIFLVIAFMYLAKTTDMLRITGELPESGRKPYSLARVQMAAWFLVIICSWLLLYVWLHRFNVLSESIMILMGITAGTGVGGMAIDNNKTESVPQRSAGFFKDVISDNYTISLFRFQNFAWTLVLIIVFIHCVFVYLKMPEFDTTLLLLMGISSGTYLGAKVTEKPEAPKSV